MAVVRVMVRRTIAGNVAQEGMDCWLLWAHLPPAGVPYGGLDIGKDGDGKWFMLEAGRWASWRRAPRRRPRPGVPSTA